MASSNTLRPLLRASRSITYFARTSSQIRAFSTPPPPSPAAKPSANNTFAKRTFNAKNVSTFNKKTETPAPTPDSDAIVTTSPPSPDVPSGESEPLGNDNVASDLGIDWTRSYHGIGTQRFPKEVSDILLRPVDPEDVEIKSDGVIYLPEIKYRRILNEAFGPGGWGLVPKGEVVVGEKVVTREYALIAGGRFISQAQGENNYYSLEGLPSAVEGVKSNALMRCCKDLGIASELWDPVYIRNFKKTQVDEVWVEHQITKKKRQFWTRKDMPIQYPFKKV
ncbi:Mitochondrial genome maintenance protein MGM101 [Colletotrichum sidae]|uniref:Mitochondrial genome maintenance protein MGM101 n=1 Tax=Colletotrichum sidae TaxID=1347389 RepID=A0A4R8TE49_9PEZI|nr:Mitochondrial genome maintenance protein MGM101 [Colletotrichum sidae]